MLNSIASYILGGLTREPTPEATQISLRTIEKEDDWLLIERGSTSGDDKPTLTDTEDERERTPSPALSRRSRRSSRCCSRLSSLSTDTTDSDQRMEESWFVTPPPCFTNVGVSEATRANSMENLLIEHPSMSVYEIFSSHLGVQEVVVALNSNRIERRMRQREQYLLRRSIATQEALQEYENYSRMRTAENRQALQNAQAAPEDPRTASEIKAEQKKEAMKISGKIHKIQNKKTHRQSYNRGPMERSNKAREVNGRNCLRRRADFSQAQRNSRANNNRKC